jgi:RHS repeat-associated protein
MRILTWLMILIQLGSSTPGFSAGMAAMSDLTARTSQKAPIQSKAEPFIPAPSLWSNPEEQRIGDFHVFSEPLLPIGRATEEDDKAMLAALNAFSSRKQSDDFSALQTFLDRHPRSAWRASLLANMGSFFKENGYFTRALDAWREAWEMTKGQNSGAGKVIADRAVAEFLRLNSNFGRSAVMEGVLDEMEGRQVDPAVSDLILNARESAVYMRKKPETSFLCGPMALSQILMSEGKSPHPTEIENAQSTTNGLCLVDVLGLANRVHMNYQMAKRTPGAKIIIPAVVHLKVNHFAAIIREDSGRYLMQDPTSAGRDIWVSAAALDDEGSGYCLVPAGALPPGWQSVSDREGKQVWGRGKTTGFDSERFKKTDIMCGPCLLSSILRLLGIGMPSYAVHAMLISLTVEDTPIGYTPSFGPAVAFTATYNQRDSTQPSTFTYPNIGKLWTFNWFSYILDGGPSGPTTQTVKRYLPGGGEEDYNYSAMVGSDVSYQTQYDSRTSLLKPGSSSPAIYVLSFPDGSTVYYNQSDGSTSSPRRVFMTEMIDAQGNTLTFNWTGSGSTPRLASVTDANGQNTTITYLSNTSGSPDYYKISKITDPFSRFATLFYSAPSSTGDRELLATTDMGGLTSSYAYDLTGFMTSMTTPYGTTTFSTGTDLSDITHRWVVVTDPLGQQERTESRQFDQGTTAMPFTDPAGVPAIPTQPPPNATLPQPINLNLTYRNTFFWNKAVMQEMGGVIDNTSYTKAHIYHWLHTAANLSSGDLESEKDPLENRVWYQYPGQDPNSGTGSFYEGTTSQPMQIDRVLDPLPGQTMGATQLDQYQYNDLGKVTEHIDPIGRTTWFNYYPNLIDLEEIRQGGTASTGDLLASFTYDTTYPRLVSTATDASGETTHFYYTSARGQLSSVVNAKSETTSFVYGDTSHPGFLTEIDGPVTGAKVTFTADTSVPYRVGTMTDSEGLTVTYAYDNFDSLTTTTYPDNTTEKTVYNKLAPALVKDRLNQWSGMEYDPLGRVVAAEDSLGQVTKFQYCTCGALESITDPNGHITTWMRDLQNRVIGKVYPDGTQTAYAYENTTSRLKQVTDAKGQNAIYTYNVDNTLQQVVYANDAIFTPGVSFTYDPVYNRVLTMSDGATGTTTYAYNPITTTPTLGAGRLYSESVPFNGNTTTYSYDELGRVTTRSIDSVNDTTTYDSLGRISGDANALGSFTYNYVSTTPRLSSLTYPFNSQEVDFTYFPSTDQQNRERLQTIQNKISGANLSKFDYTYDADGRISTWTRTPDSSNPTYYTFQYDKANQLLTAALANGRPGSFVSAISQYTYNYDHGGNRISESLDVGTTTTSGYNNDNQLFKRTVGQRTLFTGTVSANSTVTIDGVPANTTAPPSGSFSGYASVSSDSNIVEVVATDTTGAKTTKHYQLTVGATGTPKVLTYDLNGNLISAVTGSAQETYEWDGANRLVAINHRTSSAPGTRSEFTYDGAGHRVRIVEKDDTGAVTSDKHYVWCGMDLCEERDFANSSLNKKYFGQGVEIGTAKYFYSRDHLGSIREMVDSSGTIQARYDYDPYGRRTKVSGSMDSDFGFTGHFYHAPSGLFLAPYRAYDPDTGRWIRRDPIGENGGMNLYGYVGNSPVNFNDPSGLAMGGVFGVAHYHPGNGPWNTADTVAVAAPAAVVVVAYAGVEIGIGALIRSALLRWGLVTAGGAAAIVESPSGQEAIESAENEAPEMACKAAEGGENLVYRSLNAAGDVNYVGITGNLERRAAEQMAEKGITIQPIPGLQNLSRADARAVEQVLIETHGLGGNGGNLLNKINSISPNNPIYQQSIQQGNKLLRQTGYPGF